MLPDSLLFYANDLLVRPTPAAAMLRNASQSGSQRQKPVRLPGTITSAPFLHARAMRQYYDLTM